MWPWTITRTTNRIQNSNAKCNVQGSKQVFSLACVQGEHQTLKMHSAASEVPFCTGRIVLWLLWNPYRTILQ
jgi:hypothetical protein